MVTSKLEEDLLGLGTAQTANAQWKNSRPRGSEIEKKYHGIEAEFLIFDI